MAKILYLWTKNVWISYLLVALILIEDLAYAAFFDDTPFMFGNTAYDCSVYLLLLPLNCILHYVVFFNDTPLVCSISTAYGCSVYVLLLQLNFRVTLPMPSVFWPWCDQIFVSLDPPKDWIMYILAALCYIPIFLDDTPLVFSTTATGCIVVILLVSYSLT